MPHKLRNTVWAAISLLACTALAQAAPLKVALITSKSHPAFKPMPARPRPVSCWGWNI
jgi:hypothetical protein